MHFAHQSHVLGKCRSEREKGQAEQQGQAQRTDFAKEGGLGQAIHGDGIYDFRRCISNELRYFGVKTQHYID